MAIYITKTYKTKEGRDNEMKKFHNALVGSPAYANNEIAIVAEDDLSVTLCIGKNNENDYKQIFKKQD